MLSASNFIYLPYTPDLTEGGIAYTVHSLPYIYNRSGGSPYDRLRRTVAEAAVELAFRHYLSQHEIPFDVKSAIPFTEPDHHDVSLAGWRCEIKSFFISQHDQILEMKHNPQVLLKAPALVASDQNAAEGHLRNDIYLFAFLSGLVTTSQDELQKAMDTDPSHFLIHVMPDSWIRPQKWNPLGKLALKSESAESQFLEVGGQDAGREIRALEVELPAQTRVQMEDRFFSLAYVHAKDLPKARIGIHSPIRKETHIIQPTDWGNIWVYGTDILLAGFLTREEFNRRASFLREGVRVFPYEKTRTKSLAVSVCDLRPLSELFERVKTSNKTGDSHL